MNKEYNFHVSGMHCKSCVLVTESKIGEVSGVKEVKTNLADATVRVVGDFGDLPEDDIVEKLSLAIKPHGYALSSSRSDAPIKNWSEFLYAVPIALAFALLFIILQKVGLVNLVNSSNATYGTAFMIGIIASLSSCMAVVGGLVLSMSATFAKTGDRVRPQLLFHGGRLVSFLLLGGVIGALGSAFQLGGLGIFVLSVGVGIIMLTLGINLLEVFPAFKKLQPAMPKFLASRALAVSDLNHTLTPLLVGIATFFLPCGFTQSMQVYALSTGSFITGALTMFAFALGTLPVLSLLSFTSLSIASGPKSGIFFKTAGLIVIMFALFNIINGMVAYGIINPFFSL